ncbi:MAG: hypothetical protein DIU55_007780 [Bacillota bacterium]|nr:MAG: hypothetical protein DIU55_07220 [Bacillota bacterium]
MRNLWPLVKVQLLQTWRGSLERMSGTRSRLGLLLVPLLIMAFIPLVVMFATIYAGLYKALEPLGLGHYILAMALTAGQLLCLIFGVLYIISAFYFSQDLRLLIPLPLRPGEIVLSKLVSVLLGECLSMAPVVVPGLVVYGALADVGPLYIPFAVLIYLMLPVFPLVLSGLFSLLLMRVTALRRNRDLFRVFGALVGIALAIGIQFTTRFHADGLQAEDVQRFIETQQTVVTGVTRWLVTSAWGTQALQAGSPALGIPAFLLFTGATAASLALLAAGAERFFLSSILSGEEGASSRRQVSRSELAARTGRVQSPLRALLVREVRLLNRNASYLMTALITPLLLPIIILIPMASGNLVVEGFDLSGVAQSPWTPVVMLAVLFGLCSTSALPSSAISREGPWFWISQSLPVAPRVQIHAKLLHSLLFHLINLLLVGAGAAWLGILTPRNLALLLLGGVPLCVISGYSGLLVDVLKPVLQWTDPQQAMKGNINSLLAMLVHVGITAVTAAAAILIYVTVRPFFLPGLVIVLALEAWLLGRIVGGLADVRYTQYEL